MVVARNAFAKKEKKRKKKILVTVVQDYHLFCQLFSMGVKLGL
jgi:hypothetical protein